MRRRASDWPQDVAERARQLNREGLSCARIAAALKAEFGFEREGTGVRKYFARVGLAPAEDARRGSAGLPPDEPPIEGRPLWSRDEAKRMDDRAVARMLHVHPGLCSAELKRDLWDALGRAA